MSVTSVLDRVRSPLVISCIFYLLDKYQKLDPSFNSQLRTQDFILVLLDFRLWRLEKKNAGRAELSGLSDR